MPLFHCTFAAVCQADLWGWLAADAISQEFSQLLAVQINGAYQNLLNPEQLSFPTYATPAVGMELH